MAYCSFDNSCIAPAPATPMLPSGPAISPRHDPIDAPAAVARLSALEWSVVALARRDRFSSLRRPGRLAVAMRTLFGGGSDLPLADARLEALRRMAVWSWHHGYTVPTSELRDFLATGFTLAQYETMMASIGVARQRDGARR
jgi:hypothetical protein